MDSASKRAAYGCSGTAFDHIDLFSFDQAARALVFDRMAIMLPSLPTALTPGGRAYHDWLGVLRDAAQPSDDALHISIYEDDPEHNWYIARDHFAQWCESRGMRPEFLFPKNPGASALVETPTERKKRIMDFVDTRYVDGKSKTSSFEELAITEACSANNIKRIYGRKGKQG